MTRAFSDISFTDSVKAAQTLYGSREAYQRFEQKSDAGDGLTETEADFISLRDSFYQATVSETGWPYVQHRGGPMGFVKTLDRNTIGYADYRGNRQYISVGNLQADARVSLIFMDYANKRRLKLWGRAEIMHAEQAPEQLARLEVANYRARVERGIIIHVEAFDWNCPQHITPRFTEAAITAYAQPLHDKIAALTAENEQLRERQP